jgi:signal transduction histidine kinase
MLFGLRWLFLGSATLLVVVSDNPLLGGDTPGHDHLPLVLAVGAVGNLLLGLVALMPSLSDHLQGVLGVLLDAGVAVLFLWAYDGAAAPMLVMGTLAVLAASFRFRWQSTVLVVALIVAGCLIVIASLPDPSNEVLTGIVLALAVLAVFAFLGVVLRTNSGQAGSGWPDEDPRVVEAHRLRAARERVHAISQMASTLGATLDHMRVLEAAQDIGTLGLREMGPEVRLISAVLLFQGDDNMLRVVTSRRLTRSDQQVTVPGHHGVLGLALKRGRPVFAGDASRDPELRNFVAFQDAKSVLAIALSAGFDNFGVLVFGSDQPNAFSDEHIELLAAIGSQATVALQNAVLYQNLLTEKERIVEVEEDERKKLARDLHDGPTQIVAAIAMRVNYIRRLLEHQPEQAPEELWKVEELARRTTKEIRHMLFTLRPLALESQGLIAALGQLADKMRDTYDTNVIIQGQPEVEEYLDAHAQGVIFYIAEEAVNNARKHAQAEHLWVRLYRREAFVVVEIEDDGMGFDVKAVDTNYEQRGSLGMVNMRERAELVEGTLHIQSARGRGTKISVLVPVQADTGDGAGEGTSSPPLALQSQRQAGRSTSPQPG